MVACTKELKLRYFENDDKWVVEEGSVLDRDYLNRLGKNLMLCIGGVDHTGEMWSALENVSLKTSRGGTLFVAIYNDQ